MCSETEDENTMENYRLPQCETEHKHIMSKNRRRTNFKQKEHPVLTATSLWTIYCVYLLREAECIIILQQIYKIRKRAGCVSVNQIFHNITRYKNNQVVTLLQGCTRSL